MDRWFVGWMDGWMGGWTCVLMCVRVRARAPARARPVRDRTGVLMEAREGCVKESGQAKERARARGGQSAKRPASGLPAANRMPYSCRKDGGGLYSSTCAGHVCSARHHNVRTKFIVETSA